MRREGIHWPDLEPVADRPENARVVFMTVDLGPTEQVRKMENNDGDWVIESVNYFGGPGKRTQKRWVEIGVMNVGKETKTFVGILYID
jgi:hypothetical protein